MQIHSLLTRLCGRALAVLNGPAILAFLPAITLGAFWLGGEGALLLTSLGLPLVFAFAGALGRWPTEQNHSRDRVTGLIQRDEFQIKAAELLAGLRASGQESACFIIVLDDLDRIEERHGTLAVDTIVQRSGERILATVRSQDIVARLGNAKFAVCVSPVSQLDLEHCIQLAGRIQSGIEDPISLDGTTIYVSCSLGFCLDRRALGHGAQEWIGAAIAASNEARQNGPSSIRAYTSDTRNRITTRADLRRDIQHALNCNQIVPWFQPQISTNTGKLTGFEALARWEHPNRGILGPGAFLAVAEEAGLMERLGQNILRGALAALVAWDKAGADVPRIAVNFSSDELHNPGLVDRIRWDLDQFDLTPGRLTVEVLETVISKTPGDIVARNIAELHNLGCWIDLDDFGTGHASVASLKRFNISRIKIDRSFVTRVDRDPAQRQLLTAVLSLAERLNLETLGEGVETAGEHSVLAQLGCGHVQGFEIGRPMPFGQTLDWLSVHNTKLQETPKIGRDTG